MTYQELQAAAALYQIGERASLKQIKARHRELVKMHHPDHRHNQNKDLMHKINAAYEILCTYCASYRYCFTEEEFLEQVPEERLRRQFGWDPVWSGKGEPEQN